MSKTRFYFICAYIFWAIFSMAMADAWKLDISTAFGVYTLGLVVLFIAMCRCIDTGDWF